jgi:hypothetical protein
MEGRAVNKTQKKQMAYFHDLLESVCDEPIVALSFLFARATILDGVLRIVADSVPIPGNPVPDLPGVIVDKVREQHVERAGNRTQALCAVTATKVVAVGVTPRRAAGGMAADYWDLTLATEPLVLQRDALTVEVRRRLVSKVVIFTDDETRRRYEFEVHVFGTADFNDAFFAALATFTQT